MREVTVKGKESKSQPTSVSDGTIGSSYDEAATEVVQDAPKMDAPKRTPKQWFFHRWIQFFIFDPESTGDGRFRKIGYEDISSYPIGYPNWAAHLNSDPTFKVYKRFGTLRNRIILYRQQELALLEDELKRMDDEDHKSGNFKTRSLLIDKGDTESKRMKLVDQIDAKLEHYDELLEREKRSALLETPSKRNYRSLVNYVYNNKPVIEDEIQFLRHRDDFVLLTSQTDSPLETILDWMICRIPIRWIRRRFSSEAQISKQTDDHTTLISQRKLVFLARGIATSWAIVLITVPLSVLATKGICDKTKLIVLLASLLAFPIAIQVAARPRNLELFIATATYCAVLSTLLVTSTTFDISDLQRQSSIGSTLGNAASSN